jgi:hypothetical protein
MPLGILRLRDLQLTFHKMSAKDASGKCTLELRYGTEAYGVLYSIDQREVDQLDQYEGLGLGYNKPNLEVQYGDQRLIAFTYQASKDHLRASLCPLDWYKRIVIAGALYHGLPSDYVAMISAIDAIVDTDQARQARYEKILRAIAEYNQVPDARRIRIKSIGAASLIDP